MCNKPVEWGAFAIEKGISVWQRGGQGGGVTSSPGRGGASLRGEEMRAIWRAVMGIHPGRKGIECGLAGAQKGRRTKVFSPKRRVVSFFLFFL